MRLTTRLLNPRSVTSDLEPLPYASAGTPVACTAPATSLKFSSVVHPAYSAVLPSTRWVQRGRSGTDVCALELSIMAAAVVSSWSRPPVTGGAV